MASTGKGKARVAEADWDNRAGVGGPGGSTISSQPSLQPAPPSLPPLAPLPPMLAPLNPRRKRTDTVRGGQASGSAAVATAGGGGKEYPEDYEVDETDRDGMVHRVRYHYVRPIDTLQGLAIQYGIKVGWSFPRLRFRWYRCSCSRKWWHRRLACRSRRT